MKHFLDYWKDTTVAYACDTRVPHEVAKTKQVR